MEEKDKLELVERITVIVSEAVRIAVSDSIKSVLTDFNTSSKLAIELIRDYQRQLDDNRRVIEILQHELKDAAHQRIDAISAAQIWQGLAEQRLGRISELDERMETLYARVLELENNARKKK